MMYNTHGAEWKGAGYTTNIKAAKEAVLEVFKAFYEHHWTWDVKDFLASTIPERRIVVRIKPIKISRTKKELLKSVEETAENASYMKDLVYNKTMPTPEAAKYIREQYAKIKGTNA